MRSSQPSGRCTGRGPLVWPRAARRALGASSASGSTWSITASRSASVLTRPGSLAELAAHRVAGEVPAGVLAERLHATDLAAPVDETGGVVAHDRRDPPEARRRLHLATGEGVDEVAEEPRSPEAAPTDHHAVAAGLGEHGEGVVRLPDVAVAEDGDRRDVCLEGRDGIPTGRSAVELLGRAGVERDRHDPLLLGDAAGVEVGEDLVVDAHPELDGDGDGPAAATAARTMSRSSVRCTGSAEPPPLRVTLGTGHPKFMSTWSTPTSSTR